MSKSMFDNLVEKNKQSKALSFGEAAYWASKLLRRHDHYTDDVGFHDHMKAAITTHHSLQEMTKNYTAEELKPYVNDIYDNIKEDADAALPFMLKAGVDICENNKETELGRFALHADLTDTQASQAFEILKTRANMIMENKADKTACIRDLSALQNVKDVFSANGSTRMDAAGKIKNIFYVPCYDM